MTTPPPPPADAENRISLLPTGSIEVNQFQPRHTFHDASIDELAASVKEHGILQPLLVRRTADGYELIAGERRLRAARLAGLAEVPVLITDAVDAAALELALVENIQREDLNPMEEAEAFRSLAETFGMTQDQIAQRVGKARATVTNALRLLALPEEVRLLVTEDKLSAGHAKVLSGLELSDDQVFFARIAVNESLSVRALEKRIEKTRRAPRKPRAVRHDIPPDHLAWLMERLHALFGTSVRLLPSRTYANGKKAKGSLEIDFYSNEELDRILQVLGVEE
jgi:ParB family chromosome partitioning protein